MAQAHAVEDRRQSVEGRRQALEKLRRLEIQLQTASTLDRRADLSANHALAAVLRERADERRRIAAVIRAHLVDTGVQRRPGSADVRASAREDRRRRP